MTSVHKKHEAHKVKETGNKKQVTSEPVIVSDVVTETTERIEVIEEKTPDPLSDFKEKMQEEEKEEIPVSDVQQKKNYMWPIVFVLLLALIMLGGVFLYKQGVKQGQKINVVTLTPTPTQMPTPTEKPVDLSKYSIEVLNGTEIDGEAGRQRTNLEEKGFAVASVGNADSSDYTETIIQAKENVDQEYLNKLKSVLEESFTVGEMEELSEDADSDVVVIIGSSGN